MIIIVLLVLCSCLMAQKEKTNHTNTCFRLERTASLWLHTWKQYVEIIKSLKSQKDRNVCVLWPRQREVGWRKLFWSWGVSVTPDLRLFGGFSARNVAAALTDFQSTVRRSLITSDCYPLRGDFRLCHGVWPRAHLPGPGAPVSLTPWLLHRLKLISLPHWPIIKSWNGLFWRAEAGKKEEEEEEKEESSFRLSYFVGHELGGHFVLVLVERWILWVLNLQRWSRVLEGCGPSNRSVGRESNNLSALL